MNRSSNYCSFMHSVIWPISVIWPSWKGLSWMVVPVQPQTPAAIISLVLGPYYTLYQTQIITNYFVWLYFSAGPEWGGFMPLVDKRTGWGGGVWQPSAWPWYPRHYGQHWRRWVWRGHLKHQPIIPPPRPAAFSPSWTARTVFPFAWRKEKSSCCPC